MRQNGIEVCDMTKMSERFFPLMPSVDHLSVADSLDEHYGVHRSEAKMVMARHLAAAEIGGFLIFDDGSEVAV